MRIIFILVIFNFLMSCQPEPLIVDNVPTADKKMVVSTVVGSDQLLTLFLTRSYGALDGDVNTNSNLLSEFVVPNAEVWVTHDNGESLLENIGQGLYGTDDINLISGKTYQLEIYDAASNQSVNSSTEMKEKSRFDELSIEMDVGGIDTVILVKYKFPDLVGRSYFMVNVQKASEAFVTPESILNNRVFTYLVNDDNSVNNYIEGEFLALFRNISYRDTMMISLSNISYEYYDYLDRINNGFLGPSLITEPYNYPTNILGGYGFFNLYYKDNRFLVLDR